MRTRSSNLDWGRDVRVLTEILFLIFTLFTGASWEGAAAPALRSLGPEVAPGVIALGTIENPAITESSGMVASRRNRGVFWTHNDSGNDAVLFAITRTGQSVAQFTVSGAEVDDWEDIDLDNAGNLYLADIGNNDHSREEIVVYRVREPNPRRTNSTVTVTKRWRLKYPEAPFDAESFFVSGSYGYIISKDLATNGAPIYRFPPLVRPPESIVLEPDGVLPVEREPTGADLSGNRRRLTIITSGGAYAFSSRRNVLEADHYVTHFTPFERELMEGVTFTKDGIVVSTETGDLFLFNDPEFRTK
jgi:hypothetical protein